MAAETKRYDVSGKPRGGGREYPNGTILKLTDEQAAAMGLSASDVSKLTTTADDAKKADAYEEAMTSQQTMRDSELRSAAGDEDVSDKKRRTK